MAKSLVIVESPAKAKTINRYLGKQYIVKSSVGHIRDLPTAGSSKKKVDPKERARQAAKTRKMSPDKKAIYQRKRAKEQLINRMGIDPENDWAAQYETLPGKEKVVNELVSLANKADNIYLATDMDREGEAIAWHLQETLGGDASRFKRVVFNEITKPAIEKAFEKPGPVDINRVNAQQARRFLDRVVGFMLSPLLWEKIARGLSAGRVQSVALRLVVEKEQLIRVFQPEEYWQIFADVKTQEKQSINLEVKRFNGKTFVAKNEEQAVKATKHLQENPFIIDDIIQKPTSSKPSAPLITSTLQQAASTRLGFGVKKTMMLAQRLYEAGHITYMRTDSTHLSADAVTQCREFIDQQFGNAYLPEKPIKYTSKSNAQDAHEAIRPSDVMVTAQQLNGVERDAQRLYQIIWSYFVACQMNKAKYLSTTLQVKAGDYTLSANGRVVVFDGFQAVLKTANKKQDPELPSLTKKQKLNLEQVTPSQHFTKPPARFSEASLVKELEKLGIGRPSTYASIISTIQDRGYVQVVNRRFFAQKMGDIVIERLVENFAELMDYNFTAMMEGKLDSVAQGEYVWKRLLDDFYQDFSADLFKAHSEGGMRPNDPTQTDMPCEKCGRDLQVRTASTGVFLGCSGYALPVKERCKNTVNLIDGDEVIDLDEDDEAEAKRLILKKTCAQCNTAMDGYLMDEKRKLHICGQNPDCNGFLVEEGSFKIKGYDGPILACDKCDSDMQLRTGRFGKYFACVSDDCKNTRKLLRNGDPAPPKMDPVPMPDLRCVKVDDYYVLRDGAAGLFLAASGFPKNRETRAPLVSELLAYKKQIDEKYTFLFSAPVSDDDGVATVIRYSRKEKSIYVQSESDGKATGWKATYQGGSWQVQDKKK